MFVDQRAVRVPTTPSRSRNGQSADPAGAVPAMAGGRTVLRLAIGIGVLALSSYCVPALTFDATDGLSHDAHPVGSPAESGISEKPDAPAKAPGAPLAPIGGRALSANNPLWVIPLTALSGTRERPIFSSSRRPRAPAVALAPIAKPAAVAPKPKELERPKFFLVGTVASGHERLGVFMDQSTKASFRLRMGDDYQGWKLRSVEGREATLEKDQQAVILALPQTGDPPASDVPSPSPRAGTLLSATSPSRRERSSH